MTPVLPAPRRHAPRQADFSVSWRDLPSGSPGGFFRVRPLCLNSRRLPAPSFRHGMRMLANCVCLPFWTARSASAVRGALALRYGSGLLPLRSLSLAIRAMPQGTSRTGASRALPRSRLPVSFFLCASPARGDLSASFTPPEKRTVPVRSSDHDPAGRYVHFRTETFLKI